MLAAGVTAAVSLPASAAPAEIFTARGCNVIIFPWQPKIGACVDVLGVGTHVGHIKAGVTVKRGTSTRGYFHIYDTNPAARLNFRTSEVISCPPQGKKVPRLCWESRWHHIDRNLPARSQV